MMIPFVAENDDRFSSPFCELSMKTCTTTPIARRRYAPLAVFTAVVCLFLISSVEGQVRTNTISFGFDVGGNKYWGNFTDNKFGLGGDLFIRWNIVPHFSLHA